MNKFMKLALNEAQLGVEKGHGGPFGAVIVRDGKVIAKGHNMVLENNDPTAHAEIVAIRAACNVLGSYHLSDCVIYSSSEPCPMCLSAIIWARIPEVFYGCSRSDTASIGFSDEKIYEVFSKNKSLVKLEQLNRDECLLVHKEWFNKDGRIIY